MKIEAKAKPVKIRIKSGGIEHSSLASLMHNFDLKDISNLLDGRMSRWLRQQGELELADKIDLPDFSHLKFKSENEIMTAMQVFFSGYIVENSIGDLKALLKSWSDSQEYSLDFKLLVEWILNLCTNLSSPDPTIIDTLKYLYANNDSFHIDDYDWYNIFSLIINSNKSLENDSEFNFWLGKIMWKERHDRNGFKLINKSAENGYTDAILYKKEIEFMLQERGNIIHSRPPQSDEVLTTTISPILSLLLKNKEL